VAVGVAVRGSLGAVFFTSAVVRRRTASASLVLVRLLRSAREGAEVIEEGEEEEELAV